MSELIQEFDGKTLEEWETWYLESHPDAIDNATEKIYGMIESFKESIPKIDKKMVKSWVEDLVILKTFAGLKFQGAILAKISLLLQKSYRLATPAEESKGIDGFIADKPYSIKPTTYKMKLGLNENIAVPIIYYEKKKEGITIEFPE
jgi:hypothetical protein